jgi:hypothetical protein
MRMKQWCNGDQEGLAEQTREPAYSVSTNSPLNHLGMNPANANMIQTAVDFVRSVHLSSLITQDKDSWRVNYSQQIKPQEPRSIKIISDTT